MCVCERERERMRERERERDSEGVRERGVVELVKFLLGGLQERQH